LIDNRLDFLEEENKQELPHEKMLEKIEESIINLNSNINEKIEFIKNEINKIENDLKSKKEEWEKDNEEQQERYQKKLKEYQEESFDPSKIENKLKRFNQVKNELDKKSDLSKDLDELYNNRRGLLENLRETRRRKFQELNTAAERVNEELRGIVKVEVEYEGQKKSFVDEIFGLNTGARKKQLKKIIGHNKFTPQKFSDIVLKGKENIIENYKITEATAESLSEISLSKLLDLQIFDIKPSINIKLNIGSEENPKYKNTENLSVGEKCTAILMIILIHKAYPLIIDQPEDDLDNQFVTTDIVPRFRLQKGKRQCIIATHNANIPVLGDAELIQLLSAEYGKIMIDNCNRGSIDNPKLRVPVENILEGGKDAFMERKRKYGF